VAGISYLAKAAIATLLVAAPIGDTTVLLLSSLSLESLLTLMLIRERRWRVGAATQNGGNATEIPVSALRRTAPHLRARRPAPSHSFVMAEASSARWRTASGEATS
jgi:hypothetical protein